MRTFKLLSAAIALSMSVCVMAGPKMGAERHLAKGLQCESCHGPKKKIESPNIDQCRQCHNPKVVANKTKKVKPQNPHSSPHYNNELDCVLCHVQHSKPENYCSQCHKFDFKVP